MRFLTRFAIALVGWNFLPPADGPAAVAAPANVIGIGNNSCGDWTTAARENGWTRVAYQAWLGGFVSGVNLNVSDRVGNLNEGTDVPGMTAWVDNYCAANPLDTVSSAAVALAVELIERKRGHH